MADITKIIRGLLVILLIILPIAVILGAAAFWFLPDQPFGDSSDGQIEIAVPQGGRIGTVALDLYEKGLVANSWYIHRRFWVLDKIGLAPDLKAGRYRLPRGERPSELISILTSPTNEQRVFDKVLIKPGLSAREIAEQVESAGIADAGDVMTAIKELAEEYPILPNEEGLQGYLLPETYHLERPLSDDNITSQKNAETLIRIMADRFFETLDTIDPGWKKLTAVQLHEKITLASIVEREYRAEEEAPMIAAVFNNRLNTGMQLQSCATLVYALLETDEGAGLRNEYLRNNRRILNRYTTDVNSPFNTYRADGLPPGPIAIPGKVALNATFFPAETDALFFVLEYPGAITHTFTRDYADHEKAAEAYLSQFQVKD